ncbi:MAG: hypothetical protein ACLVJ6_01010 [Merdibacter sp.]
MKFLDWFVEEQGEEEKNASDMLARFELFGHDQLTLRTGQRIARYDAALR